MRQIVLDTETTGLSFEEGHRIIEIGCVELINRRYTGNYFHEYFNPQREVDPGALEVHGLTNEFLASKSLFKDQAQRFIDFIADAELIIHNAPFDIGFLDYELKLLKTNFREVKAYCKVIDTLVLARQKHPGQQNSLDALCRRYEVDNSQRDFHGALLDAKLLAEVYLYMTGGQASLFHEETEHKPAVEKKTAVQSAIERQMPLPVINASEEELRNHLQMLEKIKSAGGKLIWT